MIMHFNIAFILYFAQTLEKKLQFCKNSRANLLK